MNPYTPITPTQAKSENLEPLTDWYHQYQYEWMDNAIKDLKSGNIRHRVVQNPRCSTQLALWRSTGSQVSAASTN